MLQRRLIVIYYSNLRKQKILIVDDSELNRSILADMLGEEYEIIEAEDGMQAVMILQKQESEISLVMLDMVMPKMNGFEVLTVMNQRHWIEELPVIMISSMSDTAQIERAYELGVTDFITRPFDALIVHHRVVNTILLYAKQKKLIELVGEQVYENELRSSQMVDILSYIVEFRNGESGLHIVHVRTLTELLLKHLGEKSERYRLSMANISLVSTASALHDIGKIAIDEKILNKPGRLTPEEFEIMKTHSMVGAKMLEKLPIYQEEPLIRIAYEICRWHHERYDGRGYPDGLSGDDIPLSAQVVAMADVYDALTSDRVYKKAFSHETAVRMIMEGQCGAFNPLLLECLSDLADSLEEELSNAIPTQENQHELWDMTQEILRRKDVSVSDRSLQLLEYERMKYNFFAAMTQEIQFEYTVSPPMLTLSDWGAKKLGLDEIIMDPKCAPKVQKVLGENVWEDISGALHCTTPERPITRYECRLHYDGQSRWYRIITQAIWSSDETPQYHGAIGKAIDIHDSWLELQELEKLASHDVLTNLLNHASAKVLIKEQMEQNPDGKFAMAICDLDRFKSANDKYGHLFGDHVLKHVAQKLRQNTRDSDIVARVGGDEFLIFFEYTEEAEPVVRRIFSSLVEIKYEEFPVSISMGIARTPIVGDEYNTLFHAADKALYFAKKAGRNQYCFYDSSMKNMFSVISPIDSEKI